MPVESLIHPADIRRPSWHRLRQITRECGWRGLVFKILDGSIYRRLHLYGARDDAPVPAINPALPLTFARLDPSRLQEFMEFRTGLAFPSQPDLPHPGKAAEEWVLNQWSAGHQCHIALHQDRIVSSLWIAFRAAEVAHLGCTLSVGIDGAYAFDAFTSPDYRGRNIAPALSLHARTQTFNSQTRRIVTAILPENRSGLRAQLKAGFVPIGVAQVLRFPPFRYPFGHAEGCSIQPGTTAHRANASR